MSFYKSLYDENMIKMFNWSDWSAEAKKYINDYLLLEKRSTNNSKTFYYYNQSRQIQ